MTTVCQYETRLKKELHCTGVAKKRLLSQFRKCVSDFQEDHPEPSAQELESAFGTPEEMAHVLMAEISPKENAAYRKKKVWKWILIGIVIALILGFALYVFFVKEFTQFTITYQLTVTEK